MYTLLTKHIRADNEPEESLQENGKEIIMKDSSEITIDWRDLNLHLHVFWPQSGWETSPEFFFNGRTEIFSTHSLNAMLSYKPMRE
ncbi:hypothetical protein Avbf_10502 [Armadillidium vulgare]|nr:hypothetical protein Avbf_10502 [Armadillidium vulgare]